MRRGDAPAGHRCLPEGANAIAADPFPCAACSRSALVAGAGGAQCALRQLPDPSSRCSAYPTTSPSFSVSRLASQSLPCASRRLSAQKGPPFRVPRAAFVLWLCFRFFGLLLVLLHFAMIQPPCLRASSRTAPLSPAYSMITLSTTSLRNSWA